MNGRVFLGNVCAFTLFLCSAAILMQAIVGQIVPYRVLIGVATLAFVGVASMQDTWIEKGNGFYKLFVTLRSAPGEVMVFATSERGEAVLVAKRLADVLDGHGRGSGGAEIVGAGLAG